MYRRPRFLEILIGIREEMAREADFDVDLFVENVRTGRRSSRPAGKYSMTTDEPKRKTSKPQKPSKSK